VRNFSKSNGKTKQSALILSKKIADAAHQKSKKTNVRTPFNLKKAKAVLEYSNKIKNMASEGRRAAASSLFS